MRMCQVPSDCCRRTSVASPVSCTALPSGPIPLNDHSVITRAISLDLNILFTFDFNLPLMSMKDCRLLRMLSSPLTTCPGCEAKHASDSYSVRIELIFPLLNWSTYDLRKFSGVMLSDMNLYSHRKSYL